MSAEEIFEVIEKVTGVSKADMQQFYPEKKVLNARKIAVMLLYEEGLKLPRIADHFSFYRCTVYYDLRRFNDLIEFDKTLKKLYLACIARINEIEENDLKTKPQQSGSAA